MISITKLSLSLEIKGYQERLTLKHRFSLEEFEINMEKLKNGSIQIVAQKKLHDFFKNPINKEIDEIFNGVFGTEKSKAAWQNASTLAKTSSGNHDDSGDHMSDKDQELSLDDLGELEIDPNGGQDSSQPEEEGLELSLDSDAGLDLASPDDLPPDHGELDEGMDLSLDDNFDVGEATAPAIKKSPELDEEIPPLDFGVSIGEDDELSLGADDANLDMSSDAMEKLKEIDAIMDLDASQSSIQLGQGSDELDLGGDDLSLGGDDLSLGGDDLSLGGDDLSLGGDDLSLGGDELSLGGDDLSLGGDELSLGGDELSLGGEDFGPDDLGAQESVDESLSFEADLGAEADLDLKTDQESDFGSDLDKPLVSDDLDLDSLNFGQEEPEIKEEKSKKKSKEKEVKETAIATSEQASKPSQQANEVRSTYQGDVGKDLNDIKVAYSAEMERMQATLSNLRTDREELLNKIDKLEEDKLAQNRNVLTLRAELDEKKIELSIIRKKLNDEINELKDRLKVYDEKKLIIEEKNKILMVEMDKVAQKNKIDLKRVQMRERELEQKLELLKADSETQIRHRDLKILELKRKIDAMEFDMESISVQEKRSVESRFELEDKLDKAIKTLRSAISVLEDESDKTNALEALKKNIDM